MMQARLEIRDNAREEVSPATHEWIVLLGGNGQVLMTSETYPVGHGNAERALTDIKEAFYSATADEGGEPDQAKEEE